MHRLQGWIHGTLAGCGLTEMFIRYWVFTLPLKGPSSSKRQPIFTIDIYNSTCRDPNDCSHYLNVYDCPEIWRSSLA
jgi:hypothetical protein